MQAVRYAGGVQVPVRRLHAAYPPASHTASRPLCPAPDGARLPHGASRAATPASTRPYWARGRPSAGPAGPRCAGPTLAGRRNVGAVLHGLVTSAYRARPAPCARAGRLCGCEYGTTDAAKATERNGSKRMLTGPERTLSDGKLAPALSLDQSPG